MPRGGTALQHGDGLEDAQRDVAECGEPFGGDALECGRSAKGFGVALGAERELGKDVWITTAACHAPFGKRLVPVAARSGDHALDERTTRSIVERLEAHDARAHVVGAVEPTREVDVPGRQNRECAVLECPTGQGADAGPRCAVEPLRIFDDEDDGLLVRDRINEIDEGHAHACVELFGIADCVRRGDQDGVEGVFRGFGDGDGASHRTDTSHDLDDAG